MGNLPQSRRDSTQEVECRFCLWEGILAACTHTYQRSGMCVAPEDADVEPVDLCPSCGEDIDG